VLFDDDAAWLWYFRLSLPAEMKLKYSYCFIRGTQGIIAKYMRIIVLLMTINVMMLTITIMMMMTIIILKNQENIFIKFTAKDGYNGT
jgi:DNA-binding MurR/RpiR family transcriptional regulator